MKKQSAFEWTIPNMLSVFRIVCAPVMLALAWQHQERWFVILFVLAQITDILDGQLARALGQESETGALLDSYGDLGSYICGVTGLIVFRGEIFSPPYVHWLATFLAMYVFNLMLCALKWGRVVAGLHLYSSKITGYLQGGFLVLLFAWKMLLPAFYVMIIAGILSQAEAIIINLASARPLLNAKGIYWVNKERRLR